MYFRVPGKILHPELIGHRQIVIFMMPAVTTSPVGDTRLPLPAPGSPLPTNCSDIRLRSPKAGRAVGEGVRARAMLRVRTRDSRICSSTAQSRSLPRILVTTPRLDVPLGTLRPCAGRLPWVRGQQWPGTVVVAMGSDAVPGEMDGRVHPRTTALLALGEEEHDASEDEMARRFGHDSTRLAALSTSRRAQIPRTHLRAPCC
jgi:hypothetical protein